MYRSLCAIVAVFGLAAPADAVRIRPAPAPPVAPTELSGNFVGGDAQDVLGYVVTPNSLFFYVKEGRGKVSRYFHSGEPLGEVRPLYQRSLQPFEEPFLVLKDWNVDGYTDIIAGVAAPVPPQRNKAPAAGGTAFEYAIEDTLPKVLRCWEGGKKGMSPVPCPEYLTIPENV